MLFCEQSRFDFCSQGKIVYNTIMRCNFEIGNSVFQVVNDIVHPYEATLGFFFFETQQLDGIAYRIGFGLVPSLSILSQLETA